MGKKKKNKNRQEPLIVHSLCPVTPGVTAVFQADDNDYESFPVLLFAVVELPGELGQDVRGMISNDGGLSSAEDDEDFVGYWSSNDQQIEDFLADHGREEKE